MKAITVHVGRGELFPVWQERSEGRAAVLVDDRSLRVPELPDPEVVRVLVTATGTAVLLLGGDVLVGGRQNRVAIGSTLVAPGSTVNIKHQAV